MKIDVDDDVGAISPTVMKEILDAGRQAIAEYQELCPGCSVNDCRLVVHKRGE